MSKKAHPNLLFIRKGSAWVLVANVNNYSQLAIRNGQLFAKDVVKHKVPEARLKLRAAVNRSLCCVGCKQHSFGKINLPSSQAVLILRTAVNRAKPWLKVID